MRVNKNQVYPYMNREEDSEWSKIKMRMEIIAVHARRSQYNEGKS